MVSNSVHTVVCCGDSITRGQVSANYVELLENHLNRGMFNFVNAGVNNDFSHNVLQRVDMVIAHRPQVVTILIGTNDVIATLDPLGLEVGLLIKGLPRQPDLDWYRENMRKTVQRLKAGTRAQIGLVSIPLLGEDLESLPIKRVREYNQVLVEIASQEQVSYIPVFERQADFIISSQAGKGRAFAGELKVSMELLANRILRKESYDAISQREGFVLLTDGVHMNDTGAEIIAQEIQIFIQKATLPS